MYSTSELRNIVDGVESDSHVNVYDCTTVCNQILAKMVGVSVINYKFKRSLAAKTMNIVSVKTGSETITLDPDKMFYRILASAIFKRDTVSLEETMKHELVSYPPTLFVSEDQLLHVSKSLLAKSLCKMAGVSESEIENFSTSEVHYIIDGGMLLQTITWEKN